MRVSYNEKDMKKAVNALPECCEDIFDLSPNIGGLAWFYSVKRGKKVTKANSSVFIDFVDGVTATCKACGKDYEISWNSNENKYIAEEY